MNLGFDRTVSIRRNIPEWDAGWSEGRRTG
jgi:hypothetical protein